MKDNSKQVDGSHHNSQSVDKSRRRLFGAGVAAPVVLSLASRNAWAGRMCSPSAFNSMTFSSHHPDEAAVCAQPSGSSPATWLQSQTWPSSFERDLVVPHGEDPGVFAASKGYGLGFYQASNGTHYVRTSSFVGEFGAGSLTTASLMEVLLEGLGSQSVGGYTMEQHAVAALLNSAAGTAEPATDKVRMIFKDLLSQGYYTVGINQNVPWVGGDYSMSEYFTVYAN